MVVREPPVHVGEELRHLRPEAAIDRGRDRTGRAVARVDDDADRPRELAHVLDDEVLVLAQDRPLLVRALGVAERARLETATQILDLVAVHRLAAQAELEAVVVGRVVAAGDLDAAVEVPVEDREVDERRRHHAELDDAEPGRAKAVDQGGGVGVRGEPAVAPDAHAGRAVLERERPIGAPELPRELGVEIPLGDTADVVLAEDRRIQFNTSTWCRSRTFFEIQSRKR